MLQYTLLFLEIVLLGATAYVYWTTRKVVEEAEINTSTPVPQPGWVQNHATVTQMVQDVTQLMTELQTVANATRDDIVQQRERLQALLQQAETTMVDLQQILEQPLPEPPAVTKSEPAKPDVDEAPPESEIAPVEEISVPLELIYSPSHFGEYLRLSGCGQEVVELAVEHAQEFVLWFTTQFEDDECLPDRVENQNIGEYLEYLNIQGHDADSIKRRYVALRAYINWVNNISYLGEDAAAEISQDEEDAEAADHLANQQATDILRGRVAPNGNGHAVVQNTAASSPVLAETRNEPLKSEGGSDRYRIVFAMAEQGFDQLAIAARTGLEQEVVRMLLVMKQAQPA